MNLLGKRRSQSLLLEILTEEPRLLKYMKELQIRLRHRLKYRALKNHPRLEQLLGGWNTERPLVYGEPSLAETRAAVKRLQRSYGFAPRGSSQVPAL